jgi:DNA-binding CsgD family transcriptional regulator
VLLVFVVAWMVYVFVRNRKLMQRRHMHISRFQDIVRGSKTGNKEAAGSLKELLAKLSRGEGSDEDWSGLLSHFDRLYPGFLVSLGTVVKDLTPKEIRLCILIRLNLGTRDIARILHVSKDSVKKDRNALNEKMRLPGNRELSRFLQGF